MMSPINPADVIQLLQLRFPDFKPTGVPTQRERLLAAKLLKVIEVEIGIDDDQMQMLPILDCVEKKNSSSSSLSIESLPDELLVQIFHGVPWFDRLCGVEAVCRRWRHVALTRGWADIRQLDEAELKTVDEVKLGERKRLSRSQRFAWRNAILSRVGSHLDGVALRIGWSDSKCGSDRRQAESVLGQCPRLRHLCIDADRLESHATIDHLRHHHREQLKSLHVARPYYYHYHHKINSASVQALNEALCQFKALESLKIDYLPGELCGELRLPPPLPRAAPQLRRLSLGKGMIEGIHEMLNAPGNIDALASMPLLRSLSLEQRTPMHDLAFLQRLPHVEHLRVGLSATNVHSFVDALGGQSQLAANLRALEVVETDRGLLTEVLEHLAHHSEGLLSNLEHLGIDSEYGTYSEKESSVMELLSQLVSSPSHVEQLRSLELDFQCNCVETDWQWLQRMNELEFLRVRDPKAPLYVLCSVIRKCKKLRSMSPVPYYCHTDIKTLRAMVNAAAKAAAEDNADADAMAIDGDHHRPTLTIEVEGSIEHFAREMGSCGFHQCGRVLVFADYPNVYFTNRRVESHVLHRYKYGHLSEGKPPQFADYDGDD